MPFKQPLLAFLSFVLLHFPAHAQRDSAAVSLPGEVKWKFGTGGKIFSSPAISRGIAFIGSGDKCLYAVNCTTGSLKWKFATGGAVHSSPAVYGNRVYFGSFDGYYYSVNIHTGKLIWKFKTGGEKWIGAKGYWGMKPSDMYMEDLWDYFLSSPVIDTSKNGQTVYFGSSDGNVYALNARDGSLKWKFRTGGIVHASPVLNNGMVYIGSWDAYLYAIDAATGKEKWKFKTGDQSPMSGIQASPAIKDGILYFGARDAYLYALDAGTGSLKWKYAAENSWILGTPAVMDGVLYVGTSDTRLLLALDARSGLEKFRFRTSGWVYSSPLASGATVYFGDFTGKIYAVDIPSGGRKWSEFSTAGRKKFAGTILNKDTLDFQFAAKEADLSLYAANARVMQEFYKLGSIVSSPAIVRGVLYFGSADGNLYALNLQPQSQSQPQPQSQSQSGF